MKRVADLCRGSLGEKLNTTLISSQSAKPRIQIFLSENPFQILLGEDWLKKIYSALNSSKVVIALFSDRALTRPWVHFEAGGAWFSEKVLIPVCLGNLDPANLPKPYSNIQGCNLHESGSPYYLVQSTWKVLRSSFFSPPPCFDDKDEKALRESLLRWQASQPNA